MNISTYEARLKALANHNTSVDNAIDGLDERVEALEGGGGSGDGVFIITIDFQNVTSDKTFSEVKNAVLNNEFIVLSEGRSKIIPDRVVYTDDESDIYISTISLGIQEGEPSQGYIYDTSFLLHPNDSLEIQTDTSYTFTVTEVS